VLGSSTLFSVDGVLHSALEDLQLANIILPCFYKYTLSVPCPEYYQRRLALFQYVDFLTVEHLSY